VKTAFRYIRDITEIFCFGTAVLILGILGAVFVLLVLTLIFLTSIVWMPAGIVAMLIWPKVETANREAVKAVKAKKEETEEENANLP
jgi:hypothetical protein